MNYRRRINVLVFLQSVRRNLFSLAGWFMIMLSLPAPSLLFHRAKPSQKKKAAVSRREGNKKGHAHHTHACARALLFLFTCMGVSKACRYRRDDRNKEDSMYLL